LEACVRKQLGQTNASAHTQTRVKHTNNLPLSIHCLRIVGDLLAGRNHAAIIIIFRRDGRSNFGEITREKGDALYLSFHGAKLIPSIAIISEKAHERCANS